MKIAEVEIEYSEGGEVVSGSMIAELSPGDIEVAMDQLTKLKPEANGVALAENARVALASLFNRMNEVEMADREKFDITSKVRDCSNHENGMIKRCVIEFALEEKTT